MQKASRETPNMEAKMNQSYLYGRRWMVLAVLLLLPILALAQNPYEGIYMGAYDGTRDDGEFALIVNNLGYATLAAYDAVDDIGYVEKNIYVGSDGSFRFVTQRGAHIEGRVDGTGISGTWYARGVEGGFAGQRMPDEGPLENASGYYSGQVAITRPGEDMAINGRMVAIVAADGNSFFLLDHAFPGAGGFVPGSFDFVFDFDLGWGLGLDFDLDFGSGTGFSSGYGACGGFGFGGTWSFGVSILGIFDIAYSFSFGRPSCSGFWNWGHFPGFWNQFGAAFEYSGGLVRIEPDGLIEAHLLDGLRLEGYLDPQNGRAEGFIFGHNGANAWSGLWTIYRQYSTSNAVMAQRYGKLPDMDGDGNADILWRHAVTGQNAIWLMDSAEISAEQSLEIPPAIRGDVLWSLAAVAELNSDQRSDYFFRHAVTGEVFISLTGDAGSARFELDPALQVVGSGDFDGDALPDVLVRHGRSDANAVISSILADPVVTSLAEPEEAALVSVSVADFDGDGHPDILRMNRHTRDLVISFMNGLTPAYEVKLPADSTGFLELAGVGDFDHDGSADILRRDHGDGTVIVTRRLGEDGGEAVELGSDVPRGWQMAAVGDLDGDGSDDLVWRQIETGDNVIWLVVNAKATANESLMPVPDLHWTIRQ
jgi:hypothetical protein